MLQSDRTSNNDFSNFAPPKCALKQPTGARHKFEKMKSLMNVSTVVKTLPLGQLKGLEHAKTDCFEKGTHLHLFIGVEKLQNACF